jgi:hypothetical protein
MSILIWKLSKPQRFNQRPTVFSAASGKTGGDTNGFEVAIERSREPPLLGRNFSRVSWDLGMCDEAITWYFCRIRHGQTEQFVQTVMRKRGWMRNSWRGRMSNEGAAAWPKRNITLSRRKA